MSVNSAARGIDQTRMKLDDNENTRANINRRQAHTLWEEKNVRAKQTRMKLDDNENTRANTNQRQAHTLWEGREGQGETDTDDAVSRRNSASLTSTDLRLPSVLPVQV